MSSILLTASRKYPAIPTISGNLASHTRALEVMRDAIQTHERRTADKLSSFVRVKELIDLGLVRLVGNNRLELVTSGSGGGVSVLDDLDDVDTSGVADGDALVFDATYGLWLPVAVSGGGGAQVLDDLDDVDTSGKADGDVLTYDATYDQWVPAPPVSGGMVFLSETILSSTATTVTFSSISGSYRHLLLFFSTNITTGIVGAGLRFNGDSGANYDSAEVFGGSSFGSGVALNTSTAEIFNMPAASISGQGCHGQIFIPYYTRTVFNKEALSDFGRRDSGAFYRQGRHVNWHNTAAITQIDLVASSSTFVSGSAFSLYGIP